MPVYKIAAPNGKTYEVQAPENAKQNDLFGFVQQQIDAEERRKLYKEYGPGILETFGRGVQRGAGQLASAVTDIIPAAIGSALGYDQYAKEQMAEAAEKERQRQAEMPPVFPSYKDVEGFSDIPKFTAETIGEQIPNLLTSLIPGVGVGATVGRTAATTAAKNLAVQAAERGLIGEAAEQFVARGLQAAAPQIAQKTATGQLVGTYLGSYAQNYPEVFQNIYEANNGQMAPGAAALFTAASAALDSILPAKLERQLTGPARIGIVERILAKSGMDEGLLRSVTAGALGAVPMEGLTEGAQEAISIAAENFVSKNPKVFGSKEWDRIMESSIRGAIGGGAFGVAGGVSERAQAAAERREQYADALERRGQRQLAAEVRRQSAAIDATQAQQAQMQLPGFEAGPATQLYTPPTADEVAAKESKSKQLEMFTPEGELTPAAQKMATRDEKAAANRARQEAQRQAAADKEAQAKLKKLLSAKQLELPGFDEASIKALQAQAAAQQKAAQESGQGDLFAPPATPATPTTQPLAATPASAQPITTPETEPQLRAAPTLENVTKLDNLKAFGKLFGIGPTARILRDDSPLAGKDLSNPADAAEVKRILEAYASGKPAAGSAEKIETFLKRPEFQGVPDVTRAIEQPAGGGVQVAGEPVAGAAPGAAEPTELGGVAPAREPAQDVVKREGQQPAAIETPRETAPVETVSTAAPEVAEAPAPAPTPEAVTPPKEPGKRAKKDLAKAEQGAVKAADEQAQLVADADQSVNDMLVARLREAGRNAGLKDEDLPSPDYRGSDLHNFLRIPALFAQYRDTQNLLKESAGTPQEAKNRQQLEQIEQAVATAGPDAVQIFNQIRNQPFEQQNRSLSELNRIGLQQFDVQMQDVVNKAKADAMAKAEAQAKAKPAEPTEAAKTAEPAEATGPTDAELESLLNDFNEKFIKETGKRFFLPAYQGPAFNQADAALAQAGNFNGLLRSMLDQIKDPAIKQVLRKLRSLNLTPKIVIAPVEGGKAGSYDPVTNTITLDPRNGLNAHTFIHEAIHAAISNVLANPNHPLTKDFAKFFIQIQDRLGAAYGAQDLQEFAAELVGNPSFQAVLKSIKTPRSESMFRYVMRRIAEFLGFVPKSSAFDTGLNFVDRALDLTSGVEATATQKMFLSMGDFNSIGELGRAMPAMTRNATEQARNIFSNLTEGGGFKRMAFGVFNLNNLREMFKQELPSIQTLLESLEKRMGMQERLTKEANTKYKQMVRVQKQNPQAMKRLNDIAIDARVAGVDLLDPNFRPEPAQQAEYNRLKTQFNSLPEAVRGVYKTIRKDYDASFNQYMGILKRAAESVSPSLANRLAQEFQARKPLVGYVPFLRQGDFWVEYEDPQTGERAVSSFESVRERQQFVDSMLRNRPHRMYENIKDVRFAGDSLPPTHFVHQIINGLRINGASDAQIDGVYQAYLATFPAESLMKQFMKSKNVAGMERDIVRGYGDLMLRWARKLSNSEYIPQIDRAVRAIKNEAAAANNPTVRAAAQNISDQSAFFHNPNYSTFVHTATALSYFEYIAGNISSALVNITALPLMAWPMLVGRHGWSNATAAMTGALKVAHNNWSSMPKYRSLYNTLMEHGQLEHTTAREILEGRRTKTDDFVGLKARVMDGLGIAMSAAEKYNRAVTAIAAYDLAKQSGMSEEAALRQALNTVRDVNTSGMAVTGPRWMQTPIGRMFFTFKTFTWNSAVVIARAFHQAFKGENSQIRAAAQRQLLATYGMATVFTGVKGMPFYGAVSVLANMINALFGDDQEPFDFDEFMRNIFGELFYKGFANKALNLEIANRAGLATDLVFRDDPRGIADHGYVLSALQQAFGPLGTIAVNSERAAGMFKEGHIERAIETLAPSFIRNGLKGARYFREVATTVKGDPIMEDIGAYNSLMQAIGFAPADLSTQYEKTQAAKGFEQEVLKRRQNLLRSYDMAVTTGDSDLLSETMDRISNFNDARPALRITPDTLQRSIRARKAAEKDMIDGVRFNKKLRPEIMEKFYEDED